MPSRRDPRRRFSGLPLLLAVMLVGIAVVGAGSLYYVEVRLGFAAVLLNVVFIALALWTVWQLQQDWKTTRSREQWLATMLRSIGDGVIATDAAGRVTFMNEMAQELTGWSENEAKRQPLVKVVQTLDRATRLPRDNPIDRVVREGITTSTVEPVLLLARDGAERNVLSNTSPIRTPQGEVAGVVFVFRDVTQRELAESAFRASQEMFRIITSHISDYVSVLDLEGRRLFTSDSYGSILGPARGLYLTSSFDNLHPEDRERIKEVFAGTVRTGVGQRTEFRLLSRSGEVLDLESVATVIRDAHGQTDKVLVVSRDISARRLAEEQIRREKEFSEKLINLMPGAFYLRDARGKLLRWNHNFEKVTGYNPAELVAREPMDFFPPENHATILQRMEQCFQEGYADVETDVVAKDGRRVPYYINGMRIEIAGQICMLGIGIDISERKAAEEELRATMLRLQRQNSALAEQARSPELLDSHQDDSLRMITRLAAETLDVARVSVWLYKEDRSKIRCADLYEAAGRRHTSGVGLTAADYPAYFRALAEERAIAADDAVTDPRTCEFSPHYLEPHDISSMLDAPIRSDGRMVGVICHEHTGPARSWKPDEQSFAGSMADLVSLSMEVTQRRQAEAALREAHANLEIKVAERTRDLESANDRLKELDRLKSEFLATMSHELRTPLNSIIGFTGILRQELAGPLNDEQKKQLGMVQSSARHLLGLINDLLDLSRIESGRMEIVRETFSVADLVAEIVQNLTPLVEQKKLRLESTLDDSGLTLHSDRKRCFQVLLNLANNAVKFTDVGIVRLAVRSTPNTIEMSVQDTGIGIKRENMSHLFEAFRQVDGSARRVYEGTGLGLYLSRQLASMLGGHITAESEFGIGSRFAITVPRLATPAETK